MRTQTSSTSDAALEAALMRLLGAKWQPVIYDDTLDRMALADTLEDALAAHGKVAVVDEEGVLIMFGVPGHERPWRCWKTNHRWRTAAHALLDCFV